MRTILYAEDDRDCRELFAFVLRQNEYRVFEAINGAQAIQIVREEDVDLIILDVRMPMMTGYDAARKLAVEAPHIPVMFLSVKGLDREVDRGFSCGPTVVDYLVKPLTPDKLVSRVGEILEGCRQRGVEAVRAESKAQYLEWAGFG
ncbi:MAG: response regulator transcription factor [Anaerolineae bacterium]